MRIRRILLSAVFSVFALSGVFGQTSSSAVRGSLRGTVTTEVGDELIPGASIQIAELGRKTESGAEGIYEFKDVPLGSYTVIIHTEGFADKTQRIIISAAGTILNIKLSITSLNEEVTVTASGSGESVYESFSSVNSVGTTRISEKASSSIGEILENEAGVSKRSFGGAGTGRPTIRGFDGDRVLVLQDGVRNGSLGAQSGDHGEPVSPYNLERLEVIKGPATLLYGSNAIGGVVNAVTEDENEAQPGFRGYLTTLSGTVNRQAGVAGGLEFGHEKLVFDLNLNSTRAGDFESPLGRIQNSGARSKGGAGGAGYFGKNGFFKGNISIDRRRNGIPYVPLFESGELLSIANGGADCAVVDCQFNLGVLQDTFANHLPAITDEEVDIDMRRNNYRFVSGFHDLGGAITEGNFTVDFTDYHHDEVESIGGFDAIATAFDNDVFSYRGVFTQGKFKKLSGQFGFEGYRRSYLTVGAESLIDGRVRQHNFSIFALEEISFKWVALQFGARIENNRYRPTNELLTERDFTGFSTAFAARFRVWEGGSLIASYSNSHRPPSLEELYNFGPHVGTVSFEIGDQNLGNERSNGYELSFRQNSRRVRFNGSLFYNGIADFIYSPPQDSDVNGVPDVEDGLPITLFLQDDVRFYGADARLDVDLHDYLGVFMIGDFVDAKIKDSKTPLLRITPARLRIGTDFRYKGLSLRPEGVFVAARGADDIFPLETPTAGYGIFNLNGSYSLSKKSVSHIFTFSFQNVGDRLYRNHTNFIKYLSPEAGRGLNVSYTVRLF